MFKKLVIILSIILLTICVWIGFTYQRKVKSIQTLQTQQIKINNSVSKWSTKEQIIKNEIYKQNQLIVLEGTQEIKKTYTTTDREIVYQGNDSIIKFLAEKLNQFQTRSITIDTTYQYDFIYNMAKIDIQIDDTGMAKITLCENNINLKPLAEISNNRTITDERGFLANSFTTSEASAIMFQTQIHTYNTLVNDSNLYDKAIQNTKDNLTTLIKKLGVKDIKFNVIHSNYLVNNEVQKIN